MSTNTALAEAGLKRRERYPQTLVVDMLPPVSRLQLGSAAFVGTFSVSQQPRRFLLRSAVVSPFGLEQTPTEIARDYLMLRFPKPLRRHGAQIEECKNYPPPPSLAKPGYYSDMVYMDVVAAYWSVVYGIGWDVDYWPNKFLGRGCEHDDFPLARNRAARNYLVSICIAPGPAVWIAGKMKQAGKNRFVNHGLYRLVMDVLHSIALFAERECGAVYINTDGYIVPQWGAEKLEQHIETWGLTARCKHEGDTVVRGHGNYDIGRRKSRVTYSSFLPHRNIVTLTDPDWLMSRFGRLARVIK